MWESVWGEAGGKIKDKSEFLYNPATSNNPSTKKYKQKLIVPLTENEMMAREWLRSLADNVEEMNGWKKELNDDCHLNEAMDCFERETEAEREKRMQWSWQLDSGRNVLELAAYENDVEIRETVARRMEAMRGTNVEMRTVERNIRGIKRKMVIQITTREKEELKKEAEECSKDMVNEILKTALFIYLGKAAAREATKAKKEMIDNMWLRAATLGVKSINTEKKQEEKDGKKKSKKKQKEK